MSDAKVRVQENGVGTTDVSDIAQDHGVPIDPLAVQSSTIIRGPGALRFGPVVGGVVEATNNRIPISAPVGGVSAETRLGGTSVFDGWESGLLLDAGGKGVAVHADYFARQGASYRIPAYPYLMPPTPAPPFRGRQPNSAFRAEGAAVGGSVLFDSGYAGLSISRYTSDYEVPGLASATDGQHNNLQQTKITSRGEFTTGVPFFAKIRYLLGHSEYRHDEIDLTSIGLQEIGATFKNTQDEGKIELETAPVGTPFGALTTIVGIQGIDQKLDTFGQAILPPARTLTGAGFVFSELRFTETLRTQLAGRIDKVAVTGTSTSFPSGDLPPGSPTTSPASRNYLPKSISLGLVKDFPTFVTASLNAQRIERAPRALELFANGSDDSEKTFKIGNPDLKIETAYTIEAGLKRTEGALRFDAKAYYTRYHNFIYLRTTGNFCGATFDTCGQGASTDYIQGVYSQNDAIFRGAEIAAQWDIAPIAGGVFGVDGQYDFVRATFTDGTNVPRIPPMRLGGGLYWRDAEWSARVGLLHAFAQNDFAKFDTRTPGYNNVKFDIERKALVRASSAGPIEITAGLSGDNLLNAQIRNSVQFHKDEILLPGRSLKAFMNIRYASFEALARGGQGSRFWDGEWVGEEVPNIGAPWRGAYIGSNFGYRQGLALNETIFPTAITDDPITGSKPTVKSRSPIGGVQAGYNWALGRIVVGGEADIQLSSRDKDSPAFCFLGVCPIALMQPISSITTGLDHGISTSLRGRLGFVATPQIMPYVTAGIPIGIFKRTGSGVTFDGAGNLNVVSYSDKSTRIGWAIGAGLEGKIDEKWSLRLEYLHSDFGLTASTPVAVTGAPAAVSFSSAVREDQIRFGLSYQLGDFARF